MVFYTLASSSAGNAAILRSGGTAILLDAGISARRIAQALSLLGMTPRELDAVLVTHEHSDHVSGLLTLTKKYGVPVYASRGTARRLSCPGELLRCFEAGASFSVGALTVHSFSTSHDSADSVDYRVDGEDGSFGALTDTGYVPSAAAEILCGVDALLLEANHDVELLKSGPYPYPLKQRVLGERGHLSNEAAADFALFCARNGTRDILLAHLSAENNTPDLAEETVSRRLGSLPVRLGIAPRSGLSAEVKICGRSLSFA